MVFDVLMGVVVPAVFLDWCLIVLTVLFRQGLVVLLLIVLVVLLF